MCWVAVTLPTMLVLSGQIFSAVLVLTGAAKLLRPTDTVRAVRALKIPLAQQTVYLIAIAEVTIGGAALALPSTYLFAAQAILYASFTVWVTAAMNSGVPVASCGCLGRDDTPPYWGHVVVNVSAVAVSVGAAWTVTDWSRPEFATLLFQVAMVATGSFFVWQILGTGARLHGLASQ